MVVSAKYSVLDIMQEHKQAVDPNLIRLAEAYKTAFQKLLPLPPIREDTEEEEDSAPAVDGPPVADDEDDILADLFGEPHM